MWLMKKDAIVQELNKLRETCAVHTDTSFVEFATQWQMFSESLPPTVKQTASGSGSLDDNSRGALMGFFHRYTFECLRFCFQSSSNILSIGCRESLMSRLQRWRLEFVDKNIPTIVAQLLAHVDACTTSTAALASPFSEVGHSAYLQQPFTCCWQKLFAQLSCEARAHVSGLANKLASLFADQAEKMNEEFARVQTSLNQLPPQFDDFKVASNCFLLYKKSHSLKQFLFIL
jgi:hypothetical protein